MATGSHDGDTARKEQLLDVHRDGRPLVALQGPVGGPPPGLGPSATRTGPSPAR